MASHHHSCCRWLVASRCPCEPAQPTLDMFIVPAHLVTKDIIFRTKPPLAPLCLMVGPNSRVVCEIEPSLMTVVEDVSDQFATCDECCESVEACCFPDGSCDDLTPSACIAAGGTPQGKGTECLDPDICEPPVCPSQSDCESLCAQTYVVTPHNLVFGTVGGGLVCEALGSQIAINTIGCGTFQNFCRWCPTGPFGETTCKGVSWGLGIVTCTNSFGDCSIPEAWAVGLWIVSNQLGTGLGYQILSFGDCPIGEYQYCNAGVPPFSWQIINGGTITVD